MRKKLNGETLSDTGGTLSAAEWVKKIGAPKAQQKSEDQKTMKKKKRRKGDETGAVKVKHDLDDIQAGKTIVLTLADSEILDKSGSLNTEEVATLENSEITNSIRNKGKKNNILNSLYAEEDDFGDSRPGILGKYDVEEKEKQRMENSGFLLVGDAGKRLRLNSDVKTKEDVKPGNDGRQRISLTTSESDKGVEMQDVVAKKVKMKKRKHKKKHKRSKRKVAVEEDESHDVEMTGQSDLAQVDNDVNDDEEDDSDLFASLARARKIAKRKAQSGKTMGIDGIAIKNSVDDIAKYAAKSRNETKELQEGKRTSYNNVAVQNVEETQDATGSLIDDNIVSTTTEFTKNISRALKNQEADRKQNFHEPKSQLEDGKMVIDKDPSDALTFKKPAPVTTKKRTRDSVHEILQREEVQEAKKNSLGATLSLLRNQGEFSEKSSVLVGRKNDIKGRDDMASVNKPGDRIKLEYRDDQGRLLTPKEAFRQLSYRFHGIEPSKKTKEKRERQLQDRIEKKKSRLQGNKVNGDSFSTLVRGGNFESQIKKSQQPFVSLDIQ